MYNSTGERHDMRAMHDDKNQRRRWAEKMMRRRYGNEKSKEAGRERKTFNFFYATNSISILLRSRACRPPVSPGRWSRSSCPRSTWLCVVSRPAPPGSTRPSRHLRHGSRTGLSCRPSWDRPRRTWTRISPEPPKKSTDVHNSFSQIYQSNWK